MTNRIDIDDLLFFGELSAANRPIRMLYASGHNSRQDIERDALTSPVDKLAGDVLCNQAENYPSQKCHSLSCFAPQ